MINVQELLKQKEFAAQEEKRRQEIKRKNEEELASFFRTYTLDETTRQELTDIVSQIEEQRIFNIKGVLMEELPASGLSYTVGSTQARFVPSAFSVLHVSSPNMEQLIRSQRIKLEEEERKKKEAEAAEKAAELQRKADEKRVEWLSKRLGGAEVPELFRDFLEKENIPMMRTYFHGSAAYVANLAKYRSNPVVYGQLDGDIFAVASDNERFERSVTFYIKEIDFRKEFAQRLMEEADLDKDLATKISAALPHDRWYAIMAPRRTTEKLLEYSREMAQRLHLKNGEAVQDLLQGEVKAFTYGKARNKNGVEYSPCYLAVQDAPSAILVGKYINLYLPK